MRAVTKKAITDVTRRKLRTLLTVLGIAIGIMGLSAINIASGQLKASFQYSADAASRPDIQFFTSPTSAAVAEALARNANVTRAEARGFVSTQWTVPAGHYRFQIEGVTDPRAIHINAFELIAGRLPGAGEVLLESSDRSIQKVNIGDTITVMVRGEPRRLTVSGFTRTRGLPSASFMGEATGYMREADLESLFQISGVNAFSLQLRDYSQRDATAKQLAPVIEASGARVLAAQVGRSDGGIAQVTDGLFGIMRVLSVVALLLSVFLLLSTVTTLINEQLPTIGTMKAMGAGRGKVLRGYLTSVAIYGVIGTAVGLALGILGGSLLVSFVSGLFSLDVGALIISPELVLLSLGVGIGVPLAAATVPIILGTHITVREALSGYALDGAAGQKGRAWSARRGLGGVGVVPQTVRLGTRSLFRKRTRAVLTLLALAVSGAAFLSVQTTAYSFNTFLTSLLGTYNTDMFVDFDNPAPYANVQRVLAGVPGIAATERLEQHSVHSRWGDGLLTGVEPNGTLYQQQMIAGRWFTPGDTNVVVLSDNAAAASGLHVGDTMPFHDDLHSASWKVIGIARDGNDATLKLGVLLAPVDAVSAFRHLPASTVDTVLVKASDSRVANVNTLASRVDDALSRAGYQPSIETRQQSLTRNQGQFLIVDVLLYTVAAIVAMIGAIGLFNALAMSVLERRREVGILRSMGARSRNVAQVFWTEALALGVVSWLLGIAAGIPAAYGFVLLLSKLIATIPFAFDPFSLIWMLGFILLVATVASLGPVWGATRITSARTLRYE